MNLANYDNSIMRLLCDESTINHFKIKVEFTVWDGQGETGQEEAWRRLFVWDPSIKDTLVYYYKDQSYSKILVLNNLAKW